MPDGYSSRQSILIALPAFSRIHPWGSRLTNRSSAREDAACEVGAGTWCPKTSGLGNQHGVKRAFVGRVGHGFVARERELQDRNQTDCLAFGIEPRGE